MPTTPPHEDSERPLEISGDAAAPEIFSAALDLPQEERATYLDRVCAGNPSLRADVESLLRARADGAAAFLQHPLQITSSGKIVTELLGEAAAGAQVGPYRIVHRLAAGGMGAVYLGERTDDAFQKRVAIKLIHPSLWGSEAVARFRIERQVLADLDHPGIARLIDGGSTPNELPYLVMEYVDGVPISDYCDENRLDVNARLSLFLDVCEAVLFAHQNLVIHRDLKPSNILVDRAGRVKLLDFGIAKVLAGADGAAHEDLTTTRLPFTPRYASPEQVTGGRITTATDIYSLGIVLYELLTGAFPYDLDSKPHIEIGRIIATEEPIRPSRRVESAAARRLAGDLDMILLKALHKEPGRRYATVEDFAADIRHHLAGLPVSARPDTPGYRISKFVARNKALVAGTAAVVLITIAALAATLAAYRQATSAKREAEWQAYAASLAAAEASLRADQIDEAASHLDAAPANLRSWEWRHLRARLDRSLESFQAHAKGVTQIAFLPEGDRFITSSMDSTLSIWKGMSGERVHRYGPFTSEVESFAAVPGTGTIAVGLNNGRVFLVDQTAGSMTELLPAGPAWAFVSVSPDGSRLAGGFFDGHVRVWSLPSGSLLADWQAHVGLAFPAYSPDGKLLATGGGDGKVTLHDARSQAKIQDLPGHLRRVYRLAFSPDGSTLVTSSMDQTVNVWDVRRREILRTFREHHATPSGIAFDSGGNVVTAAGDNRVLRWSIATGAVLGEFRGHFTDVYALTPHPDGTRLLSADWNGVVKSWAWNTEDIRTLRVTTGWLIPQIYDAAWDSAESRVTCASNVGYVPIWTRAGESARGFDAPDPFRCVAFAPDGSFVVTANEGGQILLFAGTSSTEFRAVAAHRGPVLGMAIDPSGRMLATASADSSIKLWSLPEVEPLRSLEGHRGAVEDVEFSPSGDALATSGADGTIRVWDPASGKSTGLIQVGDAVVHDIAFDPSGRKLVSASRSGAVQVWDIVEKRELASLSDRGTRMQAVAWSRNGTRIAAAGSDALVRLYDAASGREIMSLHGHVSAVTSLRFGRDDTMLTSTAMDGTVRIWDTGRN